MSLPFIDLKTQYRHLKGEIDARMQAVLDHGQFIMGPEVLELEEKLAEYVGVRHAIGVCDGTAALQIALMAIGLAPGDEVITTPFTFIATGEVVALLGGKPVFVDIDPDTYNLDPALIEAAITPRTRAIMPVSLYGQCADFDTINAIAQKHGLAVIEDGAQSFGATRHGRRSGALSTIGCTSFFPSKPLGCYGDGGAIFTDDDALAARMRQLRVHGQDTRYHHPLTGMNGRLDTLQAALDLLHEVAGRGIAEPDLPAGLPLEGGGGFVEGVAQAGGGGDRGGIGCGRRLGWKGGGCRKGEEGGQEGAAEHGRFPRRCGRGRDRARRCHG